MKRKITQDIENNGFAIIKSLLTEKEIKFLLKKVNLLHSKKIIKFKGTPNRDKNDKIIYNLQNKDYRFIKILSKKIIIKILKYFLNDEYYSYLPKNVPNYNILYYNARSSGDKLDLHIDSHIPFKGKKTSMMQFVFLLEDSNEQNGCTIVVPKSHQSGLYSNRKTKKVLPLAGKAGDVIIWDSRLWHGTLENYSKKSRWALVCTFGMWWVKPMMNMTMSLPNSIYKKCNLLEKQLLGFCSIPPKDEKERINTKTGYGFLKKNINQYY
jgi:hypothetical protein